MMSDEVSYISSLMPSTEVGRAEDLRQLVDTSGIVYVKSMRWGGSREVSMDGRHSKG